MILKGVGRLNEMQKPLAFVLSGGGARGAYQVGALKALYEAGYKPDIWVGTSIGAVNAGYLAINGFTKESLDNLTNAWQEAGKAELLSSNHLFLTMRMLLNRSSWRKQNRFHDFFVAHGIQEEIKFKDIKDTKLFLVSADLNLAETVIFGLDPEQSILEGVLASTAIPPWIHPIEKDGRFLIDGGLVSNLPVEPALTNGAKEIVALDLFDLRDIPSEPRGLGPFFYKVLNTAEKRQIDIEIALAQSKGVRVHRISLVGDSPVAIWEFQRTVEMIPIGYQITQAAIETWHEGKKAERFSLFSWLRRR